MNAPVDVLAVMDSATNLYLVKEASSTTTKDKEYWRGYHGRNVTARLAIAELIEAVTATLERSGGYLYCTDQLDGETFAARLKAALAKVSQP